MKNSKFNGKKDVWFCKQIRISFLIAKDKNCIDTSILYINIYIYIRLSIVCIDVSNKKVL